MNALVVGSGGREHALAWSLTKSPKVDSVYVAPGNAGTELDENIENVPIDPMNFEALSDFALRNNCGLTIIGPEAPLVRGIVNHFEKVELPCFGPSMQAAQLEGSKAFSKDFMNRHNIPTGRSMTFSQLRPALEYIQSIEIPIVIKADGLAAGKGVIVAENRVEAEKAVQDMLAGNVFGEAGHRVIIEEFLEGEEASFIVIVDGEKILPLATSQDHKRIGDNDTGPNTGGMGAYSPAPIVNEKVYSRIMQEIILPTVKGMQIEGNYYRGFLYAGLMIDKNENARVIEYNCRLGDPETQPILMRLKSDLAEICLAALDGSLESISAEWDSRHSIGVVMASQGYPGAYKTGVSISGIEMACEEDIKVFHAGTAFQNGSLVSTGGRVLCVTSLGKNIAESQQRCYDQVDKISFDGATFRNDIGWRALKR
ncbi:MAG: phosphoribosylamine--glycine ligase [Halieaceae bacterium]|nr:phosphoribosylamine--glycine ligase [Halieaceae bacterium]